MYVVYNRFLGEAVAGLGNVSQPAIVYSLFCKGHPPNAKRLNLVCLMLCRISNATTCTGVRLLMLLLPAPNLASYRVPSHQTPHCLMHIDKIMRRQPKGPMRTLGGSRAESKNYRHHCESEGLQVSQPHRHRCCPPRFNGSICECLRPSSTQALHP